MNTSYRSFKITGVYNSWDAQKKLIELPFETIQFDRSSDKDILNITLKCPEAVSSYTFNSYYTQADTMALSGNIRVSYTSGYSLRYCSPSNADYEKLRTLTITGGDDVEDETFISWFTANATLIEEEPSATVITYNGSTIATLEAGQTATIKTAETEVEHDIIITPVFPINIAYGDIIATAEAGQTATVKCANTEVDFDIVVSAKAEEQSGNYLTFNSPSKFTLKTNNSTKNWDGTLEYSTDASTWNIWNGQTTLSANDGKLYLRGTANTKISDENKNWVLSGSNISCEGNIENLLDYATVANGEHPTMGEYCFAYLFHNCYASLISAPALPATTLSNNCYRRMFYNCTSLVSAPELPAMELVSSCYSGMFQDCTSLVNAPKLPAMTMADSCYGYMFSGCTSLVNAPALPATTLALQCYSGMFNECRGLASIPALPATMLETFCYNYMFYGCSNIKISEIQTAEYNNEYRIPTSGEGTSGGFSVSNMFASTGGTFVGAPSINTTYYTSTTVVY